MAVKKIRGSTVSIGTTSATASTDTYTEITFWFHKGCTYMSKTPSSPERFNKIGLGLEVDKWESFFVGKLFKVTLGFPIHSLEIEEMVAEKSNKNIPYVTRTATNNGVELFIENNKEGIEIKELPEDAYTVRKMLISLGLNPDN
jgi:hypothetical protein